ncbi:MAG: small, acid-soluble spore protein, alpha/beta type [Clostridiales bacterium]|nr:small, acid-soluble spore protein, alpha/beta type [Clostridiales bacterium]
MKESWITGARRRSALTYLTKAQRRKYEIAKELGLLDQVRQKGWASLSAKDTGRIGGLVSKSMKQKNEGE